jgi:hypothetical protein
MELSKEYKQFASLIWFFRVPNLDCQEDDSDKEFDPFITTKTAISQADFEIILRREIAAQEKYTKINDIEFFYSRLIEKVKLLTRPVELAYPLHYSLLETSRRFTQWLQGRSGKPPASPVVDFDLVFLAAAFKELQGILFDNEFDDFSAALKQPSNTNFKLNFIAKSQNRVYHFINEISLKSKYLAYSEIFCTKQGIDYDSYKKKKGTVDSQPSKEDLKFKKLFDNILKQA